MNFKLLAATTLLLTTGTAITNIADANEDTVTTIQPAAATAKITHKNDIAYEMQGCLRRRDTISCTLIITSEAKDNKIFIDTAKTRFIDLNGNEYFSNSARIGNYTTDGNRAVGNNFLKGIPLRSSLKFDNIPENVNSFAVLNLAVQTDNFGTNNSFNEYAAHMHPTNIRFDKISIAKEPVTTTNLSSESNNYNYQNVPVASEPVSVTDSLNSVKDTVSDVKQNVNTVRDILNIFR
jgi:hypothetical protein